MFFHFLLIPLTLLQPATPALVLGTNLIINSDFSAPPLPTGTYKMNVEEEIQGWSCNEYCQLMDVAYACSNLSLTCQVSSKQALDLDSTGQFDDIRQEIHIPSSGQYYFQI
jgi:hypothetical protein